MRDHKWEYVRKKTEPRIMADLNGFYPSTQNQTSSVALPLSVFDPWPKKRLEKPATDSH